MLPSLKLKCCGKKWASYRRQKKSWFTADGNCREVFLCTLKGYPAMTHFWRWFGTFKSLKLQCLFQIWISWIKKIELHDMICQSWMWSFLPCVVLWYYSSCPWLEAQQRRLLHEAGNRCWLGQGRTRTKWGALWDLICPFITPSGERWSRPRKDCWFLFQDRPCNRMRGKYSWVLYSLILGEGIAFFASCCGLRCALKDKMKGFIVGLVLPELRKLRHRIGNNFLSLFKVKYH